MQNSKNTKQHIQEVFLSLLKTQQFSKIRITKLCEEAHITRSTFYFHYDDIFSLLQDVINEALAFVCSHSANNEHEETLQTLSQLLTSEDPYILMHHSDILPPCYRLIHIPQYRPLLMDPTIYPIMIDCVYNTEYEKVVPSIMKANHISEENAAILFRFIVSGSLALSQHPHTFTSREWYEKQAHLLRFTLRGLQIEKGAVTKQPQQNRD